MGAFQAVVALLEIAIAIEQCTLLLKISFSDISSTRHSQAKQRYYLSLLEQLGHDKFGVHILQLHDLVKHQCA